MDPISWHHSGVRGDLGAMAIKGTPHSQSSSITGVSSSDSLVSYLRHSLRDSYSSAVIQSVYSAASAYWAMSFWIFVAVKVTFNASFINRLKFHRKPVFTHQTILFLLLTSYVSEVDDCRRERPEGSLSVGTTPRCWGRHYSFPWIAPLYPWSEPYITVC